MDGENTFLESSSHPYLARVVARRLQKDSPTSIVADDSGLWRYDGKVWQELDTQTIDRAVMELEHLSVACGYDSQTKTTKTKALLLTSSVISSIRQAMLTQVHKKRFFENVPFGLQFSNGFLTVDQDGELDFKPCSPKHKQRVLMDWDWSPGAQAPRFNQALDQWFMPANADDPNVDYDLDQDAKDKTAFLQEFTGASLLGMAPRFARAAILYGQGSNGKSIFIDTVRSIFPKEACSSIEPQSMGNEYRAAKLAGRRINFAADIPAHEIVSSSVLKAVISGDIITARHIRQDPFEFRPEAGHIFSANELPGTRVHSNGFWRRFVVVEFANRFDGQDKDVNLFEQLKAERAGIVAWMLKGAVRLLQRGDYTIPASSEEITQNWRRDADVVALWLDECTRPAATPANRTAGKQLWASFDNWRQANRYSSMGSRTFYKRLQNIIGKSKKSHGSKVYEIEVI